MPDVSFPKLTTGQCATVLEWLTLRLRPLADVLASLETPEVLAYLEANGLPPLDPTVKTLAASAPLSIGGGNGSAAWRTLPSYQTIDVFFMVPSTSLTSAQAGQLKTLLGRRWTPETLTQRDKCTIPGVALTVNGKSRYLTMGNVGVFHNGVVWPVPMRCPQSGVTYNDGRFTVVDGHVMHESCVNPPA